MVRCRATIQMFGTYELTDKLIDEIHKYFEVSTYYDVTKKNMEIGFMSHGTGQKVKQMIKSFLVSHQQIFYFDMIYNSDTNFVPDRFVAWRDGKQKSYSGHVSFIEDDWDTIKLSNLGLEDE